MLWTLDSRTNMKYGSSLSSPSLSLSAGCRFMWSVRTLIWIILFMEYGAVNWEVVLWQMSFYVLVLQLFSIYKFVTLLVSNIYIYIVCNDMMITHPSKIIMNQFYPFKIGDQRFNFNFNRVHFCSYFCLFFLSHLQILHQNINNNALFYLNALTQTHKIYIFWVDFG